MYTLPTSSVATLFAASQLPPPRYVEKTIEGTDGFTFVTNPVAQLPLRATVGRTAFATGKFKELVWPATEMLPIASTAMPLPLSSLLPPSNVENNTPEPEEFNFVTNASEAPLPIVPAYRTEPLIGSL